MSIELAMPAVASSDKSKAIAAETFAVKQAFQELDEAVFTRSHVRAVVVAGTGFLTECVG